MNEARQARKFLHSLRVPTGPRTGTAVVLAPFQKDFIEGAFAKGVFVGVLSVGRGGGKSTLSAGLALGHLVGRISPQPSREILLAARNRDQARILYDYAKALSEYLPDEIRRDLHFKRAPVLSIEFRNQPDGDHIMRCVASDGRGVLGTSPTLAILDERAAWRDGSGDDLESAILTGIGKRSGRMLIISTSASSDEHPFSVWLDTEQEGVYRQEHRADMDLDPLSEEAIRQANPGLDHHIGASLEWLQAQARRAMKRGGSHATAFRLYNLNQRVQMEDRDVLLRLDEWLSCETEDLPPRQGPVVIGVDLGGSASMTAVSYYWPESGRTETLGAFPSLPDLKTRGEADGVGDRYVQMKEAGELKQFGQNVVDMPKLINEVASRVGDQEILCLIGDRFRKAEFEEALYNSGLRIPIVYRGMGFLDGSADVDRFRKAVLDGKVKSIPSLLLRGAFADAITLKDPANNFKIAKGRSFGRIDAACAMVLAVAEGQRRISIKPKPVRSPKWV